MLVFQYEDDVDHEVLSSCLAEFRENLRDARIDASVTMAQGEVAKQISAAIDPPPVNVVG